MVVISKKAKDSPVLRKISFFNKIEVQRVQKSMEISEQKTSKIEGKSGQEGEKHIHVYVSCSHESKHKAGS